MRQRFVDYIIMLSLVAIGYACGSKEKSGSGGLENQALALETEEVLAQLRLINENLTSIKASLPDSDAEWSNGDLEADDWYEYIATLLNSVNFSASQIQLNGLVVSNPFGETLQVSFDTDSVFTVKPDTTSLWLVSPTNASRWTVKPDYNSEWLVKESSYLGVKVYQ